MRAPALGALACITVTASLLLLGALHPALVRKGANRFEVTLRAGGDDAAILKDLHFLSCSVICSLTAVREERTDES
jgi:hypothetical protein